MTRAREYFGYETINKNTIFDNSDKSSYYDSDNLLNNLLNNLFNNFKDFKNRLNDFNNFRKFNSLTNANDDSKTYNDRYIDNRNIIKT